MTTAEPTTNQDTESVIKETTQEGDSSTQEATQETGAQPIHDEGIRTRMSLAVSCPWELQNYQMWIQG